jgi:transcription elongation factor Elf1
MTRQFNCGNCGFILGERLHNTLTDEKLEIEFKRSHNLKCRKCGCYTTFAVDRAQNQIDKNGKLA